MKRFPTILAAALNNARQRPLALLVSLALLVIAADLALVAGHRFRETAHRARLADVLHSFRSDAVSASTAHYLFPDEASNSLQAGGWDELPRWLPYFLPYRAEDAAPPTCVNTHWPAPPLASAMRATGS